MSFFTTFGSFSIAAGILLIFLIFVMLAAERRGELGIARAVGTRRGHLVQMFLFEGARLRPARGRRRRAARRRGRLRDGARDGERVRSSGATSTIAYSVSRRASSSRTRIGVLLTLVVVAFSAWRVSRMNIVTAIRNLPEPPADRHAGGAGCSASLGRRRSAALLAVGRGRRRRTRSPLGLGVSLVIFGLVPLAARARRARARRATPAPGSRSSPGSCCPISTLAVRRAEDELLDLHPRRADDRDRRDLDDRCTTPTSCSARSARSLGRIKRARAGPADVDGLSAAEPLPHRRDARDVHARRLHARRRRDHDRRRSCTRSTTSDASAAVSTCRRHDVAGEPDRRHAAALAQAPGVEPARLRASSRASRRCPSRRASSATGAKRGDVPRPRCSTRPSSTHTTYGLAARARGYGSAAAVWQRARDAPRPRRRRPVRRAAPGNWGFGAVPEVPPDAASTSRTRPSTPVPSSCATRRPGERMTLTVIGVLSDSAPQLDGRDLDLAARRSRRVFGDRVAADDRTCSRCAPGVDPATARTTARVGVPRQRHAGRLARRAALHDARRARSCTFDRLIDGLHGPRPDRRRRRARRDHAPAPSSSGASRSASCARSASSRGWCSSSFLLESSFIALTSIVVGTVLGLAVAYNVIHDSQQHAELAEPAASTCRGSPSA